MLDLRLGMIGVGHIGSAILHAILENGLLSSDSVWISCPVPQQLKPFAEQGCRTGVDNAETVKNSDLIILAVRPADLPEVLRQSADAAKGKCFLSVAAGVTIDTIRGILPHGTPVMRAMPNTPITLGFGATALTIPRDVPCNIARAARDIFETSGVVELMEENLMSAATGLNGSGPGYFFRMAAVMIDCAIAQGIPEKAARNLVVKTMAGSAEMLHRSPQTPRELARHVAVPGGTTEAAFNTMDRLGFDDALRGAMLSCAARAEELGR